MAHIHTEPGQHDHTASGIIVRTDGPEPRVLLHRHKKLGVYIQFGGHIELDETPWQTVQHELLEESGYSFDQVQLLQPKHNLRHLTGVTIHPSPVVVLTHEFKPGHYHTDMQFVFITDQEPARAVTKLESNDFVLLTKEQLSAVSLKDIPENVREVCMQVFNYCLSNWEPVPTGTFH